MAVCLINPSFTLGVVGVGVPIPWKKEEAFKARLRDRGLKESQVSKVWRMYTDRDFILRHAVRGFGYLVDWRHLSGMASEL